MALKSHELDIVLDDEFEAKNKVSQPDIIRRYPHLPKATNTAWFIIGRSGSGKSVLVQNLARMYQFNDYFDVKVLFKASPDRTIADKVDFDFEFRDDREQEYVELLTKIFDKQTELVNRTGKANSPKILLIFDDFIHTNLVDSGIMFKCAIQSRHLNITPIFLSQTFFQIPKKIRMQSNYLFIFGLTNTELRELCKRWCPSSVTVKEYSKVLSGIIEQPHGFVYLNRTLADNVLFNKLTRQITL